MTIARIPSGILPWLVDRAATSAPGADALDLAEELALLDEPMPIKRETCLALEPTTRGVWPAVCNEPFGHRGPHCSKRQGGNVGVVSAVTWGATATEQGQGATQGPNVGPGATDDLCEHVGPGGFGCAICEGEVTPEEAVEAVREVRRIARWIA